jgi:GNAT superfamily N-acetyltransferase
MKLNESLYSKYLKEKDGIDTLETDKGLVTFIQQGKNGEEFYIVDIYVLPQYRRTGYATYLGELMQTKAKELGAKYLLGAVEKDSKTYSDSRAALESFGFRFAIFIEEDRIDYFKKEL